MVNKSEKMQKKACLCVIGIIILVLIAVTGIVGSLQKEPEKPVPVVRTLQNVWVTEISDKGIKLYDETEQEYLWMEGVIPPTDQSAGEKIADIVLTDKRVSEIHIKDSEKISGKVVSVQPGKGVELEGKGLLEFAPDMKIYRIYDELQMAGESAIRIGYQFCDFVMENGKICAVLITRDEAMEYIRVQIKASDYTAATHESVKLTSDTGFVLRFGVGDQMQEEFYHAGEEVEISENSDYFVSDRIYIVPEALTGKVTLLSVNRKQGIPSYRGTIEIVKKQGQEGLYVINEVLLEEYLYGVVPSEMPSSYPMEALKAQAICARTYAYGHMLKPSNKLVGAHVDDSAGYQVYNNIKEQESTTTAVKETSGQLLYVDQELVDTFYYSTSCGFGTESDIWKSGSGERLPYLNAEKIGTEPNDRYTAESLMQEEVFAEFISTTFGDDYEAEEGWYRWTYTVKELDREHMLKTLQSRYKANEKLILTRDKKGEFVSRPIKKLGKIKNISISLRNQGGIADELLIETEDTVIKVITEHNIRYVLCDGVTKVCRQDGSKVDMKTLLPSAFFVITTGKEGENVVGYTLTGGGFGHGVGMTQNGAKSMAVQGMTASEILQFFYENGYVEPIY